MATDAHILPDSAYDAVGRVITATQVHVNFGGTPGTAVWEHVGQWYQTTPQHMLDHVGNTYGRLFPGFALTTPIGNSNDTRDGEMDFHIKPDGGKVDIVTFSFVDIEDIAGGRSLPSGGRGTSLWFNGDRIDIKTGQANNNLVVVEVATTDDNIHFRYDTGHGAAGDGFAMLTCLEAAPQPQEALHFDLHHIG